MRFRENAIIARRPSRRMGRPPWFETPRTRPLNSGRSELRLLTMRAERDCECIKLIGIGFRHPLTWSGMGSALGLRNFAANP